MKRIAFIFACFLAALSFTALAQTTASVVPPHELDSERAKISAEKAKQEASFAAEEAACYKRFLVTSCLKDVNVKRREVMATLKRQEILLNDQERKAKGVEQIRKIEEKSSPERLQEAADRRSKALEEAQSRLERGSMKKQDQATAQSKEKSFSESSAEKLKNHKNKAQTRAEMRAKELEETEKFNNRQKQAQERKAQNISDQSKRIGIPAKPLPLPQ